MADNINIDAGSTLTVATDDISGVHYQVVKVAHGADGAAAHASAAAPLPVTVISATLGTVTIGGNVNVASATLGTVAVSLTTTGVTVNNAGSINVNVATATLGTVAISGTVSLSSTAVTLSNAGSINVNVATATLGTVTITGTVTPSTTSSTINNAVGNPVNVSLTSTAVTVAGTVSLSSTKVTVDNAISLSNSGVTVSIGRTLTSTSGFLNSVTAGTLATGSARIKVYGFSLTTTFAGEVICIFHSGGLELWRVDLAPGTSGSMAGANLAVAPPGFLFASRSGTAVTLSLSTAAIVHYSLSYFDEA